MAMEVLDWQPVYYSQQIMAKNQASQVAKLHHGVRVATAGLWTPQWKTCAAKRIPVSPDMKSSTFFVSTTWF